MALLTRLRYWSSCSCTLIASESVTVLARIQPAQILVAGSAVKNVQSNALWLVNLSELG